MRITGEKVYTIVPEKRVRAGFGGGAEFACHTHCGYLDQDPVFHQMRDDGRIRLYLGVPFRVDQNGLNPFTLQTVEQLFGRHRNRHLGKLDQHIIPPVDSADAILLDLSDNFVRDAYLISRQDRKRAR